MFPVQTLDHLLQCSFAACYVLYVGFQHISKASTTACHFCLVSTVMVQARTQRRRDARHVSNVILTMDCSKTPALVLPVTAVCSRGGDAPLVSRSPRSLPSPGPTPHALPSLPTFIQTAQTEINAFIARSELQSYKILSSIYLRMGLTIPPSSCFRPDLDKHKLAIVSHQHPSVILLDY